MRLNQVFFEKSEAIDVISDVKLVRHRWFVIVDQSLLQKRATFYGEYMFQLVCVRNGHLFTNDMQV